MDEAARRTKDDMQSAERTGWRRPARLARAALVAIGLLGIEACVQGGADQPPLSGPSELGISLTLQANPDVLPLDGSAQSRIEVLARDENGKPLPDLKLLVQIVSGGQFIDFGVLTGLRPDKTVLTGGDGRAFFSYTAPLASANPAGSSDPGTTVTIQVTPSDPNVPNFANTLGRTIIIRLVPPGTVIPLFNVLAGFTFTPNPPAAKDQTQFTAQYCDVAGGAPPTCVSDPNRIISSFAWDFADGGTANGQVVTHIFDSTGSYPVKLTVSDAYSRATSATLTVPVGAAVTPVAAFDFSPDAPHEGDTVFFDASRSTSGRPIVSYDWVFGDGTTGTGRTTTHVYSLEDTYAVTLTVTDDRGATGSVNVDVAVGDPDPTAVISFSPRAPVVGQTVFFSAEESEAIPGRTLVHHRWIFGDGSAAQEAGANASHAYSAAGTYEVILEVTDDFGSTDTATETVVVSDVAGLAATFTASPSPATVGTTVTLDASGSTPGAGATITNYRWDFGDGSALVDTTTPVTSHTYAAAGAFTITLTVTDSNGNTDTETADLTVDP